MLLGPLSVRHRTLGGPRRVSMAPEIGVRTNPVSDLVESSVNES